MPWVRGVQTTAFAVLGTSFLVGMPGIARTGITLLLAGALMLIFDPGFRGRKRGKLVIAGAILATVVLYIEQFHRMTSADALEYYGTAGQIVAMTFWSLIAISFLFWTFVEPVDSLLARAASGVAVPLWLIGAWAPFLGNLDLGEQGTYPFGLFSRLLIAASFAVQALTIWKIRHVSGEAPAPASPA